MFDGEAQFFWSVGKACRGQAFELLSSVSSATFNNSDLPSTGGLGETEGGDGELLRDLFVGNTVVVGHSSDDDNGRVAVLALELSGDAGEGDRRAVDLGLQFARAQRSGTSGQS